MMRTHSKPTDANHRLLLRSHPVLSSVEQDVFDTMTANAEVRSVEKGQIVFSAGDRAERFFIVAHGIIRLFRLDDDGSEATVNVFSQSQSFGEAAMFLERQFPVTAQAVETSELISVDAINIVERIKVDPGLALAMLGSMSAHLKILVDEITLLRVPTATRRAAEFLLRATITTQGRATIELEHSKAVLADRLDMAPEVLSRAFAELRSSGVTVDRKTVTISDVSKLVRLVRG